MKKKKYPVVNIGTSSILTVFVVLAMVTFAALTYMSARKDARFNQQQMDAAIAYQTAVNEANEKIAQIDRELAEAWSLGTDIEGKEYTFSVPCGEDKELQVALTARRPETSGEGFYEITCFKEISTKDWEGSWDMNLMEGN